MWFGMQQSDENELDEEEKIIDYEIPNSQECFGLRFIDDKWADWQIAEKTLKLMIATNHKKYLDLCFLLCGFLRKSGYEENEFLDRFKDSDSSFMKYALGEKDAQQLSIIRKMVEFTPDDSFYIVEDVPELQCSARDKTFLSVTLPSKSTL